MHAEMEAWRNVFREGLEPLLSDSHLEVLRTALLADDPALLQGATTAPPGLQIMLHSPVEGACPIGYCGWKDGRETVDQVETFFAEMCGAIDHRIEEPGGCRWFLNWVDETPRDEMRRSLLGEVNRALARRYEAAETAPVLVPTGAA